MQHKLIAAIFISFGLMQYNDSDFYIWMSAYFFVAFIAISYTYKQYYPRILSFSVGVFLYGLFLYFPDAMDWLKNGTPSITGTMQAESPFVEFVREFFGLVICFGAICYYWKLTNDAVKKD